MHKSDIRTSHLDIMEELKFSESNDSIKNPIKYHYKSSCPSLSLNRNFINVYENLLTKYSTILIKDQSYKSN